MWCESSDGYENCLSQMLQWFFFCVDEEEMEMLSSTVLSVLSSAGISVLSPSVLSV